MQYVKCRFQSNSTRAYTFAWDGADLLVPGDKVDVATERGEITVEVVSVLEASDHPSPKRILRRLARPTISSTLAEPTRDTLDDDPGALDDEETET